MKIQEVKTVEEAEKVVKFLLSKKAFDVNFSEAETTTIKNTPIESLTEPHQKYWFVEDEKGEIIGAGGTFENEIKTGGYVLDYFAVEESHRHSGIGSLILKTVEEYVISQNGRYLCIDTGDNEYYAPARKFYESHGYTQVGHIPFYYSKEVGRFDYYKAF